MKRLSLVALTVCVVLAVGCSGGGRSTSSSSTSGVPEDSVDAAPRAASIPALEFVAEAGLPKGASIKTGTTLATGSYKPALSGRDIDTVQWVMGEVDGINRMMLRLRFGASGTRDLAKLTERSVGKHLLVVLNGRVLDSMAVYSTVTSGTVTLDPADLSASRSEIDSATVPAQ